MKNKMYGAFIASLSAVALMLATNETFGETGAPHAGASASTHATSHPSVARSMQHHRRNNNGALWTGTGDFLYGPSNGEPTVNVAPPASGDVHYTYTYDVPWDAVHRYPPGVNPSQPSAGPYVPGCHAQAVTVPGADSKEQTVNITRCY
jgi:hypothetical protein